jgi:hypothetical protein
MILDEVILDDYKSSDKVKSLAFILAELLLTYFNLQILLIVISAVTICRLCRFELGLIRLE